MKINALIEKWMPVVKGRLHTIPWKNLFVFLFFFLLAFVFWMMLFFQKKVESTYKIPLKYVNIPEDEVFNNPLPSFIEVRVSDKGYEIFMNDLKRKDSLEIDIEENKKNKIGVIQGNQFYQIIRSRLANSTQILGYYPPSISLTTSKLEKKELNVKFDGEITTSRANLVADSSFFIPKKITAYGTQKALSQISEAITEYTVFNNLKATSQLKINIKPMEGIKFVPHEVEIYIPIEEVPERTFEVPIKAHNLPSNLDIKFFPSRVKVSFSTTLEEYKRISSDDFEIKMNYTDFKSNTDGKVELKLTQSPSNIRNVRLSPTQVEFLFESR